MTSATDKPVIIVAGPTASGKSALAMDVAEEFGGVVINADSMQVYKELRILTARPSDADEARVPHRLYGVLPASQACSVGQWRDMAVEAIDEAHGQGLLPVVTGGTGMYLNALMQGLALIPDIPEQVRSEVQTLYAEQGGDAALQALSEVDPQTAGRLSAADRQRVCRTLEVYRASGRPLSEWLAEGNQGVPEGIAFQTLVLQPPREELYARIDARFVQMVEEGALDEVRDLMALGLAPDLPAMKAVGVRELAAYLADDSTLDEAVAAAQQASRNYAKRQLTWFRNQIPKDESIFTQYSESHHQKIFSFIRQFVLTHPL